MAQFEPAIQNTELNEGGYSFNSYDSGGETYRGISRHFFPNWAGWSIIDTEHHRTVPVQNFFPACLDNNANLQSLVVQFYHQNFWKYNCITEQAIANKLFDFAVNVGSVHAIKIAQTIVHTNVDGLFGPVTCVAINATLSGSFLASFRQAAEQYHETIASEYPQDAQFLRGWLRRDSS